MSEKSEKTFGGNQWGTKNRVKGRTPSMTPSSSDMAPGPLNWMGLCWLLVYKFGDHPFSLWHPPSSGLHGRLTSASCCSRPSHSSPSGQFWGGFIVCVSYPLLYQSVSPNFGLGFDLLIFRRDYWCSLGLIPLCTLSFLSVSWLPVAKQDLQSYNYLIPVGCNQILSFIQIHW